MGAKTAGAAAPSVIAPMADMIPAGYDPSYVEHVIMPFLRTSFYQAETPSLPMIGEAFSKQYAIPYDLWGLLYDDWAPSFEKDGLSVFILGLDKRGPDNRRKRIYFSALTAELYPMYAGKVRAFFDKLLDEKNAGKPLMRRYLDSYFDLFWDLHLGVKGDEIPADVRQIGHSFNTVLGFRDPLLEIVYGNYMKVRALRTPLKQWIDEKANDAMNGKIKDPRKDLRLLLDEERRQGRGFQAKGHRLRVLPQFCGAQPVGQHDLQHHAEARQERGRSGGQVLVQEDDGRRSRQGRPRLLHAASAFRHGAFPDDFAQPREHFHPS